jgi:hypothetical protein
MDDANSGRRREWVEEIAEMPYDGSENGPAHHDEGAASVVRARHESRLLAIPGVVGVAVGRTSVGEPSIVVYLRDASAQSRVPRTLDGLPVEYRVTGEIDAR